MKIKNKDKTDVNTLSSMQKSFELMKDTMKQRKKYNKEKIDSVIYFIKFNQHHPKPNPTIVFKVAIAMN